MKLSVFPITERGLKLAKKLSRGFKGTVIYAPSELKDGGLSGKVKEAFGSSRGIVFISAAGIAVRTIAPLLKGKHLDPAVVVMDEAGRFAVSLVSGHLGGANALANDIASVTGAVPVITTATDVSGLPCAEDIIDRFGFAIDDVGKIKKINSAILDGGPVFIADREQKRLKDIKGYLMGKAPGVFSFGKEVPSESAAKAYILITSVERIKTTPRRSMDKTLVLRPREFAVGIGCMKGVSAGEIEKAVRGVLKEANISFLSIGRLSSIDIKRDEAGLTALALKYGLKADFYGAIELNKASSPSGGSAFVRAKTGARAVAEPASLLSSGAKGIWIRKKIRGRVTVAASKVPYTSSE